MPGSAVKRGLWRERAPIGLDHHAVPVTHGLRAGSGRHALTLVRATPARRRAVLAVLCLVLAAFFTAAAADLGAGAAEFLGDLAAAGHGRRSQEAGLCAIHVERDAARHRLNVLLLQAGSRAVITGCGAFVARRYAAGEVLVGHISLLKTRR